MRRRILPSITTHNTTASSWRDKLTELATLQLPEVGLFVTGLSNAERQECYSALEQIRTKHCFTIPFVHAVSAMQPWEYQYLIDNFGTERFNLHPEVEYPLEHELPWQIRARTYIENTLVERALRSADLAGFAGICFDLSHLEDSRRRCEQDYCSAVALTANHQVGANHISAVPTAASAEPGHPPGHSTHVARSITDFAYLGALAKEAFASLCVLELENSLREQLTFLGAIRALLERAASPDETQPRV